MELNYEFDYTDPLFREFLHPEGSRNFETKLEIPNGYSFAVKREKIVPEETSSFPFFIEKTYVLSKAYGVYDGPCSIIDKEGQELEFELQDRVPYKPTKKMKTYLVCEQKFDVNFVSHLLVKDNLNPVIADRIEALFNAFDPAIHGLDVNKYINDSITGELSEDMFNVILTFKFKKISNGFEVVDSGQDDSLREMYCSMSDNVSFYDEDGRYVEMYGDYLRNNKLFLYQDGNKVVFGPPAAPQESVTEVTDIQNEALTESEILAAIIPVNPSCGTIVKGTKRVLTLISWPEFKIVWKTKTVKIGCVRFRIPYPKIYRRTGKLALWIYYSYPKEIGGTIANALIRCGFNAAVEAGVAGVVLSNPAVAAGVFEVSFKICVSRYIETCYNGGIKIAKESSGWKPL